MLDIYILSITISTNEFDELKEKFQNFSFQNLKSESERKGISVFPLYIYIYIYIYILNCMY